MKAKQQAQLFICVMMILTSILVACNSPTSTVSDDSHIESNVAVATTSTLSKTATSIPTLTSIPATDTPMITNNIEEETTFPDTEEIISSGVYTVIQAGINQFSELNSYQAKQEYLFLTDPFNPESSDDISILTECVVDNLEKSAYCETEVSILADELIEINSELITADGQYWFRRQGEDWRIISSTDARIPGLIDGKINPIPYLELASDAQSGNDFVSPDGTFDQIFFGTDLKAFFDILFGSEEGQTFYQDGKEYDFSGYVLIAQEDGLIHEHSTLIDFILEETPIQIQLTQSLSNFNESVTIPTISE